MGDTIKTNVKLPVPRKVMFACGMVAYSTLIYFINYYLSFYATDIIGVSAASVAMIMMVIKQINAYQDPILGGVLDRLKPRPQGRYRAWIITGAIGTAVGYGLLFNMSPDWAMGTKIAWLYIFYFIGNLCCSIMWMSYSAFQNVLTTDTDERNSISMWRLIGTGFGSILPGLFGVKLLTYFSGGTTDFTAKGFTWAVVIYCVIGGLFGVLSGFSGKEVVEVKQKQKMSLVQTFKYIFGYRQSRWLTIAFFFNGLMNYGRIGMQAYWLTYIVGNPTLMAGMTIATGVGNMCGAAVARFLCKLLKNKPLAGAILFTGYAVSCGTVFFAPSSAWTLLIILNVIMGACNAGINVTVYSPIGDTADLIQLKEGVRTDGSLMSGVSFALKFGGVWTPALALAMLDKAGFVAGEAATAAVSSAIMFNVALLPALLGLCGAVCMLLVKMNDKMHEEVLAEMAAKGLLAE